MADLGFADGRSFNERFAVRAAKPDDLHRKLGIAASRISDILCHREQRYVGAQLTLSYDRKQIILERDEVSKNSPVSTSSSMTSRIGRLRCAGRALALPYRVFAKTSG